MGRLTKRAVDGVHPPQRGQTFLWDSELRGLAVRVAPSGLKVFVLQYRNSEGRSRRHIIGRYGVLTVEEAREKAKITLGSIAGGADPAEQKAATRRATTVADVCDWYLQEAEAGRLLGRRRRPIKASTLAMDRSRIETHIKPLLGRRQVRALKLADIERMQADIAAGSTAKPRKGGRGGAASGGNGAAARTVSMLHSIFGHAVRLEIIDENPATGVRRLAGNRKERRLSAEEIGRLGQAMRAAERNREHPLGLASVKLLLLTGFRISEGVGLQRPWVQFDKGQVQFPDTKSDAQTRVIGRAAADFLLSLPERKGTPLFFPADWGPGAFTGTASTLRRLCSACGLERVTPHTLRHTFASVAGDLGFSELTIAALLGHSARGVTQAYVHVDEAVRLAANRVSAEILKLLDGKNSVLDPTAGSSAARPKIRIQAAAIAVPS